MRTGVILFVFRRLSYSNVIPRFMASSLHTVFKELSYKPFDGDRHYGNNDSFAAKSARMTLFALKTTRSVSYRESDLFCMQIPSPAINLWTAPLGTPRQMTLAQVPTLNSTQRDKPAVTIGVPLEYQRLTLRVVP